MNLYWEVWNSKTKCSKIIRGTALWWSKSIWSTHEVHSMSSYYEPIGWKWMFGLLVDWSGWLPCRADKAAQFGVPDCSTMFVRRTLFNGWLSFQIWKMDNKISLFWVELSSSCKSDSAFYMTASCLADELVSAIRRLGSRLCFSTAIVSVVMNWQISDSLYYLPINLN